MPAGDPGRATARVHARAEQLGFRAPPALVRVKLSVTAHCWSLFVQPQEPCPMAALVGWLEPWTPLRVEFGSRQVIRADFDPAPASWRLRYAHVDLEMLLLAPDGSASATLAGTHDALAALGRLPSTGDPLDVQRIADSPREMPLLTPGQESALRFAVDAGYYRVPRPINLEKLAIRMAISPAALSERLRRAEGRVIGRYVHAGGATPWDTRTIFRSQPADEPLNALQ